MAIQNFRGIKPARSISRGHLPPPFYNAKDESNWTQYPSEARIHPHASEDIGNYGTGGYYGNTYNQEAINRERSPIAFGSPDTYRQLGDRRRDQDPERAWEQEHASKHGYRSIDERVQMAPGYRGMGPRSYIRSDERILEDLNEALCEDPFLDASDIETSVQNGEIILRGNVEDRQAKRRAEDIAEGVQGMKDVQNLLRVSSR